MRHAEPCCFLHSMRYDGGMESWDRHRPIWLAKLAVVRAELEHDPSRLTG
jgi:hypothetical protein